MVESFVGDVGAAVNRAEQLVLFDTLGATGTSQHINENVERVLNESTLRSSIERLAQEAAEEGRRGVSPSDVGYRAGVALRTYMLAHKV